MGAGHTDTLLFFYAAVNFLQIFGGAAADFQHIVEFSCEIIAGYDVGMFLNIMYKAVRIPGMLQTDFHKSGQIVSETHSSVITV